MPSDNQSFKDTLKNKIRPSITKSRVAMIIALIILALLFFWLWYDPAFSEFFNQTQITETVQKARKSNLSILWMTGIYVVAGIIFFPITVLNLTTAIVFGPLYGIIISLIGSVASASVSYAAGRLMGNNIISFLLPLLEKIERYTNRGGIVGMTIIRLIPIAPFTVVNLAFGLANVGYLSYVIATILGLLPGILAKAMFGGALGELWQNPEPKVIFFVVGSLALWIFIIWGTQKVFRHYKEKINV